MLICCWTEKQMWLLRSVLAEPEIQVVVIYDLMGHRGRHTIVLPAPAPVDAEERIRQRGAIVNAKCKVGLGGGFIQL